MKKYFAEFLGTLLFVIISCGGIGAAQALMQSTGNEEVTLYVMMGAALSLLVGVGVLITHKLFKDISGAHLNPAVSLAMLVRGKLSVIDFIGYASSQLLASVCGAGLLYLFFETGETIGACGFEAANNIFVSSMWQAFAVEAFAAFVFVLLFIKLSEKDCGSTSLIIGLSFSALFLLAFPFTGGCLNPARAFGPALICGGDAIEQLWLFVLAPMLGAALAAGVNLAFNYVKKEKTEE